MYICTEVSLLKIYHALTKNKKKKKTDVDNLKLSGTAIKSLSYYINFPI